MVNRVADSRGGWLVVGVVAGLCISYFWPHETAMAITSDRSDQFAIITAPISAGSGYDMEAVFVLDFLTGRLRGAILNNRTKTFTYHCYRNVASDFQVETSKPKYAIVGAHAALPNTGRQNYASGVVYVAEYTSGKVGCYAFPYQVANKRIEAELTPIDSFSFRQQLEGE